jgi:hypothetical protein
MVTLIYYEWKKHFLKKSVLIALIVFSLINTVKIFSVYQEASPLAGEPVWEEAYWRIYDEFSGDMTAEKIQNLLAIFRPLEQKIADRTASDAMDIPGTYTGNVYSDYHLLNWYYIQPMEYAYTYRGAAARIADAAHENIAFYQEYGNTYETRKNAAIARIFEGRYIPGFYYTETYQHLVQYDFSVLLVLLLCIFGIAAVFSAEKETEMELILLTSRHGGYKTAFAKMIASVLFASAVCVWFWALDFVAFSMAFSSFEGAAAPLYTLLDFTGASINVSLGIYALLSGLCKTMGIFALCMCFLLIASLFKNALLPFIVSIVVCVGFIFGEESLLGSSHVLLKTLNPFILIMNRELFRKTEFVNIAGYPVPGYVISLAVAALWILLFGALVMQFYRKNTAAGNAGRHV